MTDDNDDELATMGKRRPFDYIRPTLAELRAVLGPNWVIARRTARIVQRYGPGVMCVTQERMRKIEADIIARRGWARPAEKVIADLIGLVRDIAAAKAPACFDTSPDNLETCPPVAAARAILAKAREP